jgi:hypothetical protein
VGNFDERQWGISASAVNVCQLVGMVGVFAANIKNTHASTSGVVKDMASVYSGYSYERLVATWAVLSSTYVVELDWACKVVAEALDVAAEVIAVVKAVVLIELAALAASYAAVMATPGLAGVGEAVTVAARRLCDQMQQCLVGYVVAGVIAEALELLEYTIDRMINGVDVASRALGVSPPDRSFVVPQHIEPDELKGYARVLDDYGDEIIRHVVNFADDVAKLEFTTPGRFHGIDSPGGVKRGRIPPASTDLPRITADPPASVAPTGSSESVRGISGPRSTDAVAVGAGPATANVPTTGIRSSVLLSTGEFATVADVDHHR